MKGNSFPVLMLRTLSAMLLVLAIGMAGARIVGGLDVSGVLITSLITIAVSNLWVASSIGKSKNEAE